MSRSVILADAMVIPLIHDQAGLEVRWWAIWSIRVLDEMPARQEFMGTVSKRFRCFLISYLLCVFGISGMAAEFCIETSILQGTGNKQRVVGNNLTLFAEQKVYDFLGRPHQETLILDERRQVLVVMDLRRRLRCELNAELMLKLNKALNTYASGSNDSLQRFFSDPQFDRHVDPALRRLSLTSEPLSYVLDGLKPPDVDAIRRYRVFADWSARLNAFRSGLPANPRLAVNRELAQMAILPSRVTKKSAKRPEALSSTHEYRWELTDADRELIRLANAHQQSYLGKAPEEFFSP